MNPLLSIVVVVYDMAREAPRTLFSLSCQYQTGCREEEYEVIVVENGSPRPLGEELVRSFGVNFRYRYLESASSSPAAAVNVGRSMARGRYLGVMVDGARIASPGLVKHALMGMGIAPEPLVATLAWHLGPDLQFRSIKRGYDRQREDELLASIGWERNGYRLFQISTLAGSSRAGFFHPIAESNCFFLRTELFDRLGGYDERFVSRGGGLVNLDFYRRAAETEGVVTCHLLGEGTFHQIHGGVSTNVPERENVRRWHEFEAEYRSLRGEGFRPPRVAPLVFGHLPKEMLPHLDRSIARVREDDRR